MSLDNFSKINDILNQIIPIAKKYQTSEKIYQEKVEIEKKIKEKTIHIVFFGAYNSGKSTLINAMLGEEKARIADIPTTDSVDNYNYRGFVIKDTPGVNAPIEHENITIDELKRCNLIVFIIREGNQDTKDVYDRLFNFLKEDKEIFLVLNYEDEENLDEFRRRINYILSEYQKKTGIEKEKVEKLSVIGINGALALKGRIEKKEKLIEFSNYTEFDQKINSWFSEYNNEKKILGSIANHIESVLISPLFQKIGEPAQQSENPQINSLKGLNKYSKNLKIEKISILHEIRAEINQRTDFVKSRIINALQSDNPETELNNIYNELCKKISNIINEKMQRINQEFLEFKRNENIPCSTEKLEAKQGTNEVLNEVVDKSLDVIAANSEDIAFNTLKFGRKIKIPWLKGRWEKTLEKWAGKAAWFITAAIEMRSIYNTNKKEEALNREERNTVLAFHMAVEEIISKIKENLTNSVEEFINAVVEKEEMEIKDQQKKISSKLDKIDKDRQKLCMLERNLLDIVKLKNWTMYQDRK